MIEIKTPMGNAREGKPAHRQSNIMMDGGAVEVNGQTGQVRHLRSQTFNPSDHHAAFTGILGTARTPAGAPINDMTQINDDTIVNIKGVSAPVSSAVRAGLLVKLADGTYTEPGVQKPNQTISYQEGQQAKAKAAKEATKRINLVGHGNAAVLRQMKAKAGPVQVDNLISKGLAAAIPEKNLSGETVKGDRLAKEMTQMFPGLPPEDAVAFVETLLNEVEGNAADYISNNLGVDGDAVMEFAATKLSKNARTSIMTGLYYGDKTTIRRLVQMYKNGERA